MSNRDDDRFRVRPGAPKQRGDAYVNKVLRQANKAGAKLGKTAAKVGQRPGSRLGRGHVAARFAGQGLGANARRVTIKARLVNLAKAGPRSTSTKNSTGTRDPEMHQTKKGNQWHHGMKAHIGSDADQGLVHSVATTAANAHDITQAHALLHGEETDVFADSGYRGVEKREEILAREHQPNWHIAMMPSKRKALDKDSPMGGILEKLEKTKARIRAKVEHPFRVIKRQFGYVKVKYRGLDKNTANLVTLFALSNLWMVRKRLLNMGAQG